METKDKIHRAEGLIKSYEINILDLLPGEINPMVMMKGIMTSIYKNPRLAECTPASLLSACFEASQLGLIPDSILGLGHLVPFKIKGTLKAVFIPGYQGYIDLAHRSGNVAKIWSQEVMKGEEFKVFQGTRHEIEHNIDRTLKRMDPKLVTDYYACIKFQHGEVDFEVMMADMVEAVRQSSPAKDGDAWTKYPILMGKKTVLRRLLKRQKINPHLSRAAELDDRFESGIPTTSTASFLDRFSSDMIIDVEAEVVKEGEDNVKDKRKQEADNTKKQTTSRSKTTSKVVKDKLTGKFVKKEPDF